MTENELRSPSTSENGRFDRIEINDSTRKRKDLLYGPCAALVLCGRAVLSVRVNKPYMNCRQHENIGKAMAVNYYGSPVHRDL